MKKKHKADDQPRIETVMINIQMDTKNAEWKMEVV
jgi:hypothetical protein